MACTENQVEDNFSSMLQRRIEEYRIIKVKENVSSMLQRQIEEYRIDMTYFTVKEAETIVNFISRDYENRRIRNEHVWRVDDLRKDAYRHLVKLLEIMDQNTPLSLVDKEKDLHSFSHFVQKVKGSFKGAWLDELVRFSHENEKILGHSVNDLKLTKEHQEFYSERFRYEIKMYTETSQETRDQLQQIKAQIEDAKKANRKRKRGDGDGDGDGDDDGLEELESSEQSLSRRLEIYGHLKDQLEIQLKVVEAKLVEVREKLNLLAPNFRPKLDALEFDIFSPTILAIVPNLTGGGLRKKNGDAGLDKMIPTKPPAEEGPYLEKPPAEEGSYREQILLKLHRRIVRGMLRDKMIPTKPPAEEGSYLEKPPAEEGSYLELISLRLHRRIVQGMLGEKSLECEF